MQSNHFEMSGLRRRKDKQAAVDILKRSLSQDCIFTVTGVLSRRSVVNHCWQFFKDRLIPIGTLHKFLLEVVDRAHLSLNVAQRPGHYLPRAVFTTTTSVTLTSSRGRRASHFLSTPCIAGYLLLFVCVSAYARLHLLEGVCVCVSAAEA